jgi:hypothetical protein
MEVSADEILKAARIPFRHHDTRISTCNMAIATYLQTDGYREDIIAGVGAVIHGASASRFETFAAMARGAALLGRNVRYVTMPALMLAVTEDNHPAFDEVAGAVALYVATMYDHSIPMPLDYAQRMHVEEFLQERTNQKKRNYYSMTKPIAEADWWSEGFRVTQGRLLRSFAV